MYYEDEDSGDIVGEMGQGEHRAGARWPGDGLDGGTWQSDYDGPEDEGLEPDGRGTYMPPANAHFPPDYHRYKHHEHGGPYAGRRWVDPLPPAIVRQQSSGDYGPGLAFAPTVHRPMTASSVRALSWTKAQSVSSPRDVPDRPYSATQRRASPYNEHYGSRSVPGGPPDHYRPHLDHFDGQPPRDYLREDGHPLQSSDHRPPPHSYARGPMAHPNGARPVAYPNGLPPPNMYRPGEQSGSRHLPPSHPQRPTSVGQGGRPTSAGSSKRMMRTNQVHPAGDGDWDESSQGVGTGHYEMMRREHTGIDGQSGHIPGHACRSRPPSAKSFGTSADRQARSRPLSAVSRPRSAVSRSSSAAGQPYSDDGWSEHNESRGANLLYNPGKAHLNGVEAHGGAERLIERAPSIGVSEIDSTPRMESNEKTAAATRSSGVLDMGLDVDEACQSGRDAPGTNPSSQNNNPDAKRGEMAAEEPNIGNEPPAVSLPSKSVIIGGEESRLLPARKLSQNSSQLASLSKNKAKRRWLGIAQNLSVEALQDIRDSYKRAQGDIIYNLDNAIKQKKVSEDMDLSNFRGVNADEPYDWRRKRPEVDKVVRRHALRVFWFSISGFVSALLQNELIYLDVHPHDVQIQCLKFFTSATTLLAVVFVFKYYFTSVLFQNIFLHLHKLKPLDVNVSIVNVMSTPSFWIELCIILPHCPPFFTSSISVETMMNTCVYRAENIGAAWMLLRTYSAWRVYRDLKYAQLPKRHSISNFTGAHFDSIYIFKRSLIGWNGVFVVGGIWMSSIIALGYLFRIAEFTACLLTFKDHPVCETDTGVQWSRDNGQSFDTIQPEYYPLNGFWLMFVTSTTVGYGDVKVYTHLGRLACVLMGVLGSIYAALLTASLSNALQWSAPEIYTLQLLEREKARQECCALAADRIVYWWRKRQHRVKKPGGIVSALKHLYTELKYEWSQKHSLLSKLHQTKVDIEDLASEEEKVDRIFKQLKYQLGGLGNIKTSVLDILLKDEKTSFGCRQHIKLGFTGNRDDRHHLKDAPNSHFKLKTGELIKQDVRKAALKALTASQRNIFAKQTSKQKSSTMLGKSSRPQMTAEEEKALRDKVRLVGGRELLWYHKLSAIDDRKILRRRQASFFGVLGTLCALAQNEWLMSGGSPLDGVMFTFKASNTFCTILTIVCILRGYYLARLYKKLQEHVHYFGTHEPIKGYSWLCDIKLWTEIIVVGCHNPPFYSASLAMSDMGLTNIYVMRSETMMASFNMLRMYLLWRVCRDWMVSDLPKRVTVAGFQKMEIGSTFAIKRMLNSWYAAPFLCLVWFTVLFLLAYWFRAVEVTACQLKGIPESEHSPYCQTEEAQEWVVSGYKFTKVNDYYLYNAFWLMIITSTTVGYGDMVPTTSMGRLISCFSALAGLVFTSLFTASLSNTLNFSGAELTANMMVDREICRLRRREVSALMIQVWWHRFRPNNTIRGKVPRVLKKMNLKHLAVELRLLAQEGSKEIDEASHPGAKIENSWVLVRKTDKVLVDVGKMLWHDEFTHQ